ncbi:hypothetical protein DFH08DRAFT_811889 [Mycena albidolilacea]|uniref:Uncharacterized protein n=1 Tax=Mycena albidolilacea TaxID=1033008 RepID=A0AAD7ENZ2_9AGAR|nr:hypothetical protein DFH08DRAFT_811889 [Mycena albidolilacea]
MTPIYKAGFHIVMRLGELHTWISVDGVELSEFAVEYSLDAKEASCWIPSECDNVKLPCHFQFPTPDNLQQFSVKWKIPAGRQGDLKREIGTFSEYTAAGLERSFFRVKSGARALQEGHRPPIQFVPMFPAPTSATFSDTSKVRCPVSRKKFTGGPHPSHCGSHYLRFRVPAHRTPAGSGYRASRSQATAAAPTEVMDLTADDDDAAEIRQLEASRRVLRCRSVRLRVLKKKGAVKVKSESSGVKQEGSSVFAPGEVIDLT